MHWWQLVIRLVFIANCFGTFRNALRAGRNHQWQRLHWLVPKTIGWAALFFALLPARWGVGKNHWEAIAWVSLLLLGYGMIIEMTDASRPLISWMPIEVPHFGTIGFQHMTVIPLLGFLLVGWDILQRRRVTSKDEVLLIGFSMGLVFGMRLFLRQFSLTSLSDVIELMKPKPRPPKKQPETYWMNSGEE